MARKVPQAPPRDLAPRQERLEQLVQAHYPVIWRLLRRLGLPEHAADDAAQQVFLVALERMDDIKPGSERAFAFGTALRVAQGARRKLTREVNNEADRGPSPLPDPETLSDHKRARELLDRLLERLPLELRSVFVLFELEGLNSPEIAEIHGLPLGTVASRLRRARALFRKQLRRSRAASLSGGSP